MDLRDDRARGIDFVVERYAVWLDDVLGIDDHGGPARGLGHLVGDGARSFEIAESLALVCARLILMIRRIVVQGTGLS